MEQHWTDDTETEVALTVAITDVLESHGFPPTEYQLYEYVDVDALARLVETADEDMEVTISVEGIPLRVTPEAVTVLAGDSTTTASA